ncbi:MAG TPA: hypothetical protein VN812_04700 [Candidatus Acidoferrales bacterium]|nr:hypothetical protein [Candidatus Acidoferrales bacterium]
MRIQHVYISSWRGDVRFTRCAVASIRYWYPDIPISLIKDTGGGGDYDTGAIESHWRVGIYPSPRTRFGFAGKLEPLFGPAAERVLVVDSDVVFLGPVLHVLSAFSEDFVVNGWNGREDLSGYFYDVERLRELAPGFRGDERAFNVGQLVATSGVLQRDDFNGVVEFSEPPRLFRPDIFRNVDQGPLNYVVLGKHARRELTVRWHNYMWWAGDPGLEIDMRRLQGDADGGYPMLLHWAGFTTRQWRRLPHVGVLDWYERLFYSRIPHGGRRRLQALAGERASAMLGGARRLNDATVKRLVGCTGAARQRAGRLARRIRGAAGASRLGA